MSVGITGKFLFGLAGMKTSGMNVVAGMPVNGNQIDLGVTGRASISAPVSFQLVNSSGIHLNTINHFDTNSYFSNFGNPGLAVDLGFATKVNPEFEFSMSLIDLGFISWTKNTTIFSESGHFLFSGINLNTVTSTNNPPTTTDVKGLMTALKDSIRNAFFPTESNSKFTTLLPVKLYVAGNFIVNEDVSMGVLARLRMFDSMIHTSLTASLNARVSGKTTISASYSVMESTYDNLGLGGAFRIGRAQLYAASDNVIAFFQPAAARNANLRIGINFIFRDEAKKRSGSRRSSRSGSVCPLYK